LTLCQVIPQQSRSPQARPRCKTPARPTAPASEALP
jgi:hypothetical protein